MKATDIKALFLLLFIVSFSCENKSKETVLLPSGSCEAAWNDSTSMEFVAMLEESTSQTHPVWKDFDLGDGPIVLHAIESPDSTQCLGLWKKGKLLSYLETKDKPLLSTPLYGYQLNFRDMEEEKIDVLVRASQQPESITNWLNENYVESAVLIPTDFPKFPFKLSTHIKVQLALHESFHVELMLRKWYTGVGPWPTWDSQPNRNELRQCFVQGDSLTPEYREEQEVLAKMIEALLDEDKQTAIERGRDFLNKRAMRYDNLKAIEVTRGDGKKCSCEEGENIMELEEGLADYGSWTMLYELGTVTRKSLIQRYNAIQLEPFYLTGAMLMHAAKLMNSNNAQPLIDEIIDSSSQEEGAVIQLFREYLDSFSTNR